MSLFDDVIMGIAVVSNVYSVLAIKDHWSWPQTPQFLINQILRRELAAWSI